MGNLDTGDISMEGSAAMCDTPAAQDMSTSDSESSSTGPSSVSETESETASGSLPKGRGRGRGRGKGRGRGRGRGRARGRGRRSGGAVTGSRGQASRPTGTSLDPSDKQEG